MPERNCADCGDAHVSSVPHVPGLHAAELGQEAMSGSGDADCEGERDGVPEKEGDCDGVSDGVGVGVGGCVPDTDAVRVTVAVTVLDGDRDGLAPNESDADGVGVGEHESATERPVVAQPPHGHGMGATDASGQ